VSTRKPAIVAALAICACAAAYLRLGPLPDGLLDLRDAASVAIVDRNGEPLYEARAGDGSRTSWLAADRLPQPLVDATVAAEDRRFFSHPGVDPVAIARAAARNLKNRRWLEGGSTITQQAVKLLLARKEGRAPRGMFAKLREAAIALRLEHRLSKREILALYLNLAPYGNQLAGANRASRAYFGHEASLLTPAQSAFLAALPQRPSTYNPYRDPQRARRRQERVIIQMGLSGKLDPAGIRSALDERMALVREQPAFVAPHFVERVMANGGLRPCATAVSRGPCLVKTTLDASLQRTVNGIIRAARPTLERHGAHNVAAVVLDNASGEWLAWEGSGGYDDAEHGGQIDGVVSPRQPGSALKPFTYALAFEDGTSPATVLPDVPSFFPTAQEGIVYSPRNYDNRFRGPLLARRALAGSQNVPAVALESRIGVPELLRFLRSAGFTTFDKNAAYYGLGLTLGDAEVRLDELVAAYATFARGGAAVEPSFTCGAGPCGQPRDGRRLVSGRTAFWITDILSDDEARAYAFGRGGSLEFPFAVAAKTGTSQGYHDNWTVGYTREVTVGVWVGNFDRRALVGSSGVTGAGPIFHAIMLAAAARATGMLPDTSAPATAATSTRMTKHTICALSGLSASAECPARMDEWIADERAAPPCTWHRQTPRGVVVDWPAEYRAWASMAGVLDVSVGDARLKPHATTEAARLKPRATTEADRPKRATTDAARLEPRGTGAGELRVVNPPDGAVYLIDPTLRREFQTIGLRGASASKTRLEWRVDGQPIGMADSDAAVDWPLTPGRHVISAHDSAGRRANAEVVVK
jgi:penicillin-binding protein 1C